MPTISTSLKDLYDLLGKKLSDEQLREALEYAKAEVEKIEGDEIHIQFNDTNQPYLWSVEGLTRWLKGVLDIEKGIPKLTIEKTTPAVVNVDKSVKQVRPYLAAFIARGNKLSEYLLKQIIQLQEKFCETYGQRRKKVSIGVYPARFLGSWWGRT